MQDKLILKAFKNKENICVVNYAREYINRKTQLGIMDRNSSADQNFFVSFRAPYKTVKASTIAKWILQVMSSAGVDTDRFKAHSTRGAGTSAAKGLVPIDMILASGGWSSPSTFSKFYDKPLSTDQSLGTAIASRF